MNKVKISFSQIKKYLGSSVEEFPKYSTQILNLANQDSQATRPKTVGQLSQLIQEFKGNKLEKWEEWYLKKYPKAIEMATKKLKDMVTNFKDSINKIDDKIIKKWVKDLVVVKTFIGLKFQEAILKKGAEIMKKNYRLSSPAEESKGIDGFIGDIPVSIKPETYKIKKGLSENIKLKIIYYEKLKDGIEVDYSEIIS
jgi:hypothetical protein